MNKPQLSIIILSFNTKDILRDCLNSLAKVEKEANFETIVVDNASADGTAEMVKKQFPKVILVENKTNLGFAAGNNSAREVAGGKYILFLNSDTTVEEGAIKKSLEYISTDKNIGALTCRVVLKNGNDDLDTRRRFPTPWVALTHFSRLDKLFPNSNLFSRYWINEDPTKIAEIDVLQGAFALVPKIILDKINWFNEDYFLDGEDIDLCWKIKKLGKKIVYYPEVKIIHLKGFSKGKNKLVKRNFSTKLRSVWSGLNSMEIFYKKRMWKQYPLFINYLVVIGIYIMKLVRLIKLVLTL